MIAIVLALLLDAPAAKADDAPTVIVTQPDESKFPTIDVYFEVRKPDGTFVRDAKEADFTLKEGGKPLPIDAFEAPVTVRSRPTTIVLVVDRSGSMNQSGKIGGMRRAVATFLDGLPAGSRVAVVTFGSEVELACPFTSDKARVRRAIDAIRPGGATRYFDGVMEALRLLEGEEGRRAVLALTDGMDSDSLATIEDPIAEGRRLNLPVHTLGLGRDGEIAEEPLDRLAEGTRGQSYRAKDADALKKIYEELAERLGSTYRLTYRTDRKVPDGTLRPIQVGYVPAAVEGATEVFIPGMVVPAAGWPRLYLGLVAGLGMLAILPMILARRVLRAA